MSVCNLDANSTVAAIVEAMLPRGASRTADGRQVFCGSEPVKALYIHLDLRLSYYSEAENDEGDDGEGQYRESADVHLIFCRPTNYTKVFACVNDKWGIPKPESFTMKSDHDSCWRTDGMRDISQTYLACLGKLCDRIGREGNKRISEFSTVKEIKWVEITWKDDPEDQHRYRKLLTSIGKAP